MRRSIPITKDLVLVGGGHAHALVLRAWGMNPLPGARLTLIDPLATTAYTGMLPGFVAGHYSRDELAIDLVRLARFAGARFLIGPVTGLDPDQRRITVEGHGAVPFDVAALNFGATAAIPELPGFAEHGTPVRPLGAFARAWVRWLDDATEDAPIALIGAGIGGVELALAMAHRRPGAAITLIDPKGVLPASAAGTRRKLVAALKRAGVMALRARAVRVEADHVEMEDGSAIAASLTVGTAGVRAASWVADTPLAVENGFVSVDDTLRSTSHPDIFAAGDCAHMVASPRPKAGVYAVRQAPVLLNNLRAALGAGRPQTFRPQRDFLKLVSLGEKSALAEKFGRAPSGPWLWRWKDAIDRRFMDKLTDLPDMAGDDPPAEAATGVREASAAPPVCGGCGAKVGADVLGGTLAALSGITRDDVRPLPGDDAAALIVGGKTQVITTDHLRAFSLDHALVARTAAIHALGDIHAMGAEPQAALAQIILPSMTTPLQARTLADIMTAATEVFGKAGASIIGGHTTEGAELTVGFTITGLTEAPITLAGAQPGDVLILTKPIGTGVLLAAEMALQGKGSDIAALWSALAQDQGKAAKILSGAHAMTDVTGFGLAGHLANICKASDVGAWLNPGAVPLFSGAEQLAARGVRSNLFEPNRQSAGSLIEGLGDGPRHDLLFDPQTSGGLLAAVAPETSDQCLEALAGAGYQAAAVGAINDGPPGISLLGDA